jgi:hypothetical protein
VWQKASASQESLAAILMMIAVLDWYSWSAELPSLIRNKNHQQENFNPQSIDACVHSRREKALLKSLGATKQSEENRNVLFASERECETRFLGED